MKVSLRRSLSSIFEKINSKRGVQLCDADDQTDHRYGLPAAINTIMVTEEGVATLKKVMRH